MKFDNLVHYDFLHTEDINNSFEKALIADDVFAILKEAYTNVEGGLHFKNSDELICKTSLWRVIYYNATIVGVVVYKSKNGLKMVALALANFCSNSIKNYTKQMLSFIFKLTFNNSWMEVSEAAEKFILKNGGEKYLVPNKYAAKLTKKDILALCDDGYHYKREINGIIKTKVIIGNPKFKLSRTNMSS